MANKKFTPEEIEYLRGHEYVLDVTDSPVDWKPGDKMAFSLYYMHLLYCFSTRHVAVKFI